MDDKIDIRISQFFYMFTIVFSFLCANLFSRWLHSSVLEVSWLYTDWSLKCHSLVSQILSSPMDWTRVYFLHRAQETRSSRWYCVPKKKYLKKKTTVSREVIIIYLFRPARFWRTGTSHFIMKVLPEEEEGKVRFLLFASLILSLFSFCLCNLMIEWWLLQRLWGLLRGLKTLGNNYHWILSQIPPSLAPSQL